MMGMGITILCLSGFVLAGVRWLKISAAFSPLVSISFIAVVLYLFALSGQLRAGANMLMISGLLLFAAVSVSALVPPRSFTWNKFFRIAVVFTGLGLIAFFLAWNMAFTVIDDYVYWGIMGKYLFINDHLPVAGNPLDVRILAYTPGAALIHYFFYHLFGRYSTDISYFAQGVVLISALGVLVKEENIKSSVVSIGLSILLLTLFFGSIFTKLQVDYLLSSILFAIFWICYCEKDPFRKLLTIALPICFLFLIKEIGLLLGWLALMIVLADILAAGSVARKEKVMLSGMVLTTGAVLTGLKLSWTSHVAAMGFTPFHSGIHLESIQAALQIFSDPHIRNGAMIFMRELFFGPADRLNLPYLLWYALMAFWGYKIYRQIHPAAEKRFKVFAAMVFSAFVLYLFLLYCLQIIVFNVGTTSNHTVGFARYCNILFSPIALILVMVFTRRVVLAHDTVSTRAFLVISFIMIGVLVGSRVEVSLNRDPLDLQVEAFSRQISSRLDHQPVSIGVVAGKNDHLAHLQFLYYLLPAAVDYHPRQFQSPEELEEYLLRHEYLIVFHPDPQEADWLRSYIMPGMGKDATGLFKVWKNVPTRIGTQGLLERVMPEKEG